VTEDGVLVGLKPLSEKMTVTPSTRVRVVVDRKRFPINDDRQYMAAITPWIPVYMYQTYSVVYTKTSLTFPYSYSISNDNP